MRNRIAKKMIYEEYANMKPISAATLETTRKQTAKYLWVKDKTGTCECEYCQAESKIEGTKHLKKATCPTCGRKLIVRHSWRASRVEDIDWRVTADSPEDGVVVYRYVLCYRVDGEIGSLEERAREVINYNTEKIYHLEKAWDSDFFMDRERTVSYFRETGIMNHWVNNRFCCRSALPIRVWGTVRKALPDLKYCAFKGYRKGFYVPSVIREYRKEYQLFEKLEKVGLDRMIVEWMNDYYPRLKHSNSGELHKMLYITKDKLNHLRKQKDNLMDRLDWLQQVDEIEAYDICKKVKLSISLWNEITRNLTKGERDRNIKYCIKNNIPYEEYARYLGVANELGYDIHDNSYAYPKDFRKMDHKMSDEWDVRKNEMERKRLAAKSGKIKAISTALKQLPELQQLLKGSKGFLVYVPESAEDLLHEGKDLHNCIGTYVDRVANGKTLLFFIRRLNDPTAPFVAMEYCHGQIIQCRYDHNKAVEEDCEIYDFAKKVAEIMKKNNILVA